MVNYGLDEIPEGISAVVLGSDRIRRADLIGVMDLRSFPVVIIGNQNAASGTKGRICLPEEGLGEIVPHLKDIIRYEYSFWWRRLFQDLGRSCSFSKRGLSSRWR